MQLHWPNAASHSTRPSDVQSLEPLTQGHPSSAPNPPVQGSCSFFLACFLHSSAPSPASCPSNTQLLPCGFAQVVLCTENVHLPTPITPIPLDPVQRLPPPKAPSLCGPSIALVLGVPCRPAALLASGHSEGLTDHLQTHVSFNLAPPYREHSAWQRRHPQALRRMETVF